MRKLPSPPARPHLSTPAHLFLPVPQYSRTHTSPGLPACVGPSLPINQPTCQPSPAQPANAALKCGGNWEEVGASHFTHSPTTAHPSHEWQACQIPGQETRRSLEARSHSRLGVCTHAHCRAPRQVELPGFAGGATRLALGPASLLTQSGQPRSICQKAVHISQ